jgi:hypothetical protein
MRAYRARKRALQREMLAAAVISAEAAAWFEQAEVRRRADAVFCSVRCRVRVRRARQRGSGQQDDHHG